MKKQSSKRETSSSEPIWRKKSHRTSNYNELSFHIL
ncbi:unnamed protein product [Arabidopsis halleri]